MNGGPMHHSIGRQAWVGRLACAMGLVLGVGCAEQQATSPPPAQSTARVLPQQLLPHMQPPTAAVSSVDATEPSAAAGALSSSVSSGGEAAWAPAVRLERWSEAAELLDALPEAERARPEIRYVRARAAIGVGDYARAASLLQALEESLPALRSDIVRRRAEAAAQAGASPEAIAFLSRSSRPKDLGLAAEALHKSGDLAGARKLVDKAVSTAHRLKRRDDEVELRAIRAKLHEAAGATARALLDLRWIALHAAETAEAKSAREVLSTHKQPLTTKERFDVVSRMIDEGHATDAIADVERLSELPGVSKTELLHTRAMVLYKARSWADAAEAFETAAATKSGREAEQLFYAARALARTDRAEEAIKQYEEIVRRYRSSFWSERATYLRARLLLDSGRFKEAADAYKSYLTTFPKSEKKSEAEYERALALLSSDSPKTARQLLSRISARAKGDRFSKLRELEGVAALRAGDRDEAVKIWTSIATDQPLGYAALVSRARLAAAGAPLPPLLEPAVSRTAEPLDVKLPETAALLASLGLDEDAETYLASHEREATRPYDGRESEALCAMYGTLAPAKRRLRIGASSVSFASLKRAPSAAERWGWECLYPRPYQAAVSELEEKHSIPSGFLHSIMRQESGFDPDIVSPVGAVGLMQIMPGTAKLACGEMSMDYEPEALTNPDFSLRLGAFYVGKLQKTFNGNLALTAAAYNAGPQAVSRWLAGGADQELDLFVARIPYDETRNYVARVLGNFARYQWLAGGDAGVTPLSLALPSGARCAPDDY